MSAFFPIADVKEGRFRLSPNVRYLAKSGHSTCNADNTAARNKTIAPV